MPQIIHLLTDRVANQIAAGEVVQRPGSALKELMENSLDAGSDEIHLLTKDGGKALIQVIDNGLGMIPSDALLSFSRHATSKITLAEDLFQIQTMGFRGEALASIAAVAQVVMKTRHHEEELGTQIRIEGSMVVSQQELSCPTGTSVEVRNLFYNIPARRNFLKSTLAELRHLVAEVERISLAHPSVLISFFHDGRELLHLPKGTLLQRITHLFGAPYAEKVVPVYESTDLIQINGFIGKPAFAKKTRGEQYFHLNGRFIRDASLHHAVMSVYQEWIPASHYPFYSIHFTIDPSRVDINVHPSKTEIKFMDEKLIYAIVQSAVKRSLGKFHLTPSIDFGGETGFEEMSVLARNQPIREPVTHFNPDYNPFHLDPSPAFPVPERGQRVFSESLMSLPGPVSDLPDRVEEPVEPLFEDLEMDRADQRVVHADLARPSVMQLHKEFILTSIHSGMILLDQQASHERILYEQYLRVFSGQRQACQQTLFPQTCQLSASDAALVSGLLPDFKLLGFEIRDFGRNTFLVEGIPADLSASEPSKIIEELITNFKENKELTKLSQRENLARSLSRRASIKPGKELSVSEMHRLIDQLFACSCPTLSPGHKPTFITFSLSDLKKKFKE